MGSAVSAHRGVEERRGSSAVSLTGASGARAVIHLTRKGERRTHACMPRFLPLFPFAVHCMASHGVTLVLHTGPLHVGVSFRAAAFFYTLYFRDPRSAFGKLEHVCRNCSWFISGRRL